MGDIFTSCRQTIWGNCHRARQGRSEGFVFITLLENAEDDWKKLVIDRCWSRKGEMPLTFQEKIRSRQCSWFSFAVFRRASAELD